MLQLGYGYVSGNLIKGQPYTLKFSASAGVFNNKEFEAYIKWYISKSANFVSMTITGFLPPKPVYITIVPIVDNLTSDYIIDIFNKGIDLFRKKYTPEWAISKLTYVDITTGTGTEVIKKEIEEGKLPAWGKDLAIIGGITVVTAIAIMSIIKKV